MGGQHQVISRHFRHTGCDFSAVERAFSDHPWPSVLDTVFNACAANQLHLTDQAHIVLADANTAVDGLEEEIFAGLKSAQRDQFVALLHHATRQAKLPVGIHPGIRRRRPPTTL